MRRRDAAAPGRLAALRDAVREALPDPPPEQLLRALDAPAPTDPDLAAQAEQGVVTACLAVGVAVPRRNLAAAVRTSLFRLEADHPGRLIEVRVPPFGAVQIGAPGVSSMHTRGTPPNVVETDAATWLALAAGTLTWPDARARHLVRASGAHADLGALLG